MKIETPQILLHDGSEGNGKAAPLYSISILPTSWTRDSSDNGVVDPSPTKRHDILATAGNTPEINLWKISLNTTSSNDDTINTPKIISSSISPPISHHLALSRHERSVNAIKFSPRGTHLATAGDGGSLILFSIPQDTGISTHQAWTQATSEKDLTIKILSTHCEDIMDISWSYNEKRLLLGSLDHSILVFEQSSNDWRNIWRNRSEHTHYVQGVAYDPLNVYLASQGSDRTVRVWGPKKKKRKGGVLVYQDGNVGGVNGREEIGGKFEVGKAKVLKYRYLGCEDKSGANTLKEGVNTNVDSMVQQQQGKKCHLFADESTVESFFRRLAWTVDGAFLITPASLYSKNVVGDGEPSFATYLFARHNYEKPFKVFSGLEKPSVCIRPNPILFKLPKAARVSNKENIICNPSSSSQNANNKLSESKLPYRSIFAVLTLDSIILYDTYHTRPLCIARGLHYAGLTDATWSADGHNLIVTSTDGYMSILSFDEGELGEVYIKPKSSTEMASAVPSIASSTNHTKQHRNKPNLSLSPSKDSQILPPCDPGQTAALVAPPTKKAKKTRIAPVLISTSVQNDDPVGVVNGHDSAKEGQSVVTKEQKQKKRITPMLMTTYATADSGPLTPPTSQKENHVSTPILVEPVEGVSCERSSQRCGSKRDIVTAESTDDKSRTVETDVVGAVTNLSLDNGNGSHKDYPQKKHKIIYNLC